VPIVPSRHTRSASPLHETLRSDCMTSRKNPYVIPSIATLAVGIAAEGLRLLFDRPWYGYADLMSDLVSTTFATLWFATALSIAFRRRSRTLQRLAWAGSLASVLAMIPHAIVTYMGGSHIGLAYLALAAMAGFCLKRLWGWNDEWERYPEPPVAAPR
jgi:hypothetical protein